MKTRKLGALTVSSLGLGCMSMSQSYGERNDPQSIETLERAIELGVTFWDTADAYGDGHNESLIGKVLGKHRDRVTIATKCGIVKNDYGQAGGVNGRPEYIRQACDASLQRLGIQTIDLYYLHRVDPNVPIEESVGAMTGLLREGKVRFLGLSEVAADTLRRAHKVHPISAVQSEYSLWFREPEEQILPACRELGVGFVPFSPLGRAILTGNIAAGTKFPPQDFRSRLPRFQPENLNRNVELVERFQTLAQEKGCTASQLALAWLLAKGQDIVPIPGTKRRKYLEENAAAADINLFAQEMKKIEAAIPAEAVAGPRYPEDMMKRIDRA